MTTISHHLEAVKMQTFQSATHFATIIRPFQKGEPTNKKATAGGSVILIALLIIGACAAAGLISGVAVGGCLIGFTSPFTLAVLAKACKTKESAKRNVSVILLICTLSLIIIGALGVSGVLPATTVGWVICGAFMLGTSLFLLNLMCKSKKDPVS